MALQHLRSSTANKRPLPAGMSDGQLAINTNTASPGLFFKDSAGALIKVGPVHVGTTAPNASPASGGQTGNTVGEQWLDTTGGTYVFKVWDGSSWRSETGTFVDVNGDVMTGALGIIAGSAATPGLYFSGDTNTGLYSPGADQLALSTNGTGRLFINSSGSVGVGTSVPSDVLTVGGANAFIKVDRSNGSPGIDFRYNGSTTNRGLIDVTGDGALRFAAGGNTERMRITSAGLVGVGTSSVGYKLHLKQTDQTFPGSFAIERSDNTNKFNFAIDGNTNLNFGYNDSTRMVLTNGGSLGIGTSTPAYTLVAKGGVATTGIVASIINPVSGGNSKIHFTDDATYNWTAGTVGNAFAITPAEASTSAGTPALYIDSSRRVGIGTQSPGAALHVVASNYENILLSDSTINNNTKRFGINCVHYNTAEEDFSIIHGASDSSENVIKIGGNNSISTANGATNIRFYTEANQTTTASSERMRIDSSGRLLVGTSSSRGVAGAARLFQVEGTSATSTSITTVRNSNDTGGPTIILGKTRATTNGGGTIVAQNDQFGSIQFAGADGNDLDQTGASITAFVDGTPGVDDMPGRLVFSTTADGASSPTERMRITSGGILCVNRTSGIAGGQLCIDYTNDVTSGLAIKDTKTTGTGVILQVLNGSGTVIGQITQNQSTTTYATSSDYRLKENVTSVTDGITRLQQLKPSRFNFIADPSKTVDGFIAHEAQAVVPECVTGTKDEVDADGNPVYQGIDQSKLVPLLTAALQEAIGEIESLKARVAALESA